jgi:hypothetical protein
LRHKIETGTFRFSISKVHHNSLRRTDWPIAKRFIYRFWLSKFTINKIMTDGNGEPNLVPVERKRFATVDEDEFQRILKEKDSVNTRRVTNSAVRTLQAYLREKGQTENFEDLSKTDLYMVLNKFYTEARQENGQMYKKSSMFALRHDLNRYLSCKSIDLIHDTEFKESNKTFAATIKELKRQGLGGVDHHPPVEEEELRKVYSYFDLNDNIKL